MLPRWAVVHLRRLSGQMELWLRAPSNIHSHGKCCMRCWAAQPTAHAGGHTRQRQHAAMVSSRTVGRTGRLRALAGEWTRGQHATWSAALRPTKPHLSLPNPDSHQQPRSTKAYHGKPLHHTAPVPDQWFATRGGGGGGANRNLENPRDPPTHIRKVMQFEKDRRLIHPTGLSPGSHPVYLQSASNLLGKWQSPPDLCEALQNPPPKSLPVVQAPIRHFQ